jgi:putative membrane protein
MKNRRFEILADVGVDAGVDAAVWARIAENLSAIIDREGFERGICEGVARIGEVLEEHFPREPGDVDELPDRPSVEV